MLYIPSCELNLNDTLNIFAIVPKVQKKISAWRFMQICLQLFFKQGLLPVTHLSKCAHVHTGKQWYNHRT